MPKLRKTSKEDIINACIKIVRKEGFEEINARRLAKELGCSTQPLFYIYKNMEEIKKDVIEEIYNIFYENIFKSNYEKLVYKDIGRNYVMFAIKEPVLYKILFASEKTEAISNLMNLTGPLESVRKLISNQTGLDTKDALEFHKVMWLYTNGITSSIVNNIYSLDEEEIDRLLGEHYFSRLLFECKLGKVKQEVVDFYLNNKLIRTK